MTITRHKGGTLEHQVDINAVRIPDLWHIAMRQDAQAKDAILEVWHLAHDLKNHLTTSAGLLKAAAELTVWLEEMFPTEPLLTGQPDEQSESMLALRDWIAKAQTPSTPEAA